MRPTPWHDVVGAGVLTAGALLAGRGRAFAAGVAVGLLWEVPFAALKHRPQPLHTDVQPWPLPPLTQPVVHALWDGGLLVVGQALARALPPRHELAAITAWGAGQELVAELVGNGRVWQWHERPYNPALFRRGDVAYTLLPQLAWTLAPAVHRALVRRLERPAAAGPAPWPASAPASPPTSSWRSRRRRGGPRR